MLRRHLCPFMYPNVFRLTPFLRNKNVKTNEENGFYFVTNAFLYRVEQLRPCTYSQLMPDTSSRNNKWNFEHMLHCYFLVEKGLKKLFMLCKALTFLFIFPLAVNGIFVSGLKKEFQSFFHAGNCFPASVPTPTCLKTHLKGQNKVKNWIYDVVYMVRGWEERICITWHVTTCHHKKILRKSEWQIEWKTYLWWKGKRFANVPLCLIDDLGVGPQSTNSRRRIEDHIFCLRQASGKTCLACRLFVFWYTQWAHFPLEVIGYIFAEQWSDEFNL